MLGVAARIEEEDGVIKKADLILNAVGPAPIRAREAEEVLIGKKFDDEAIAEAVKLAPKAAKPLDNTDYMPSWRKKMVPVYTKRALESLKG